MRSLIFRITLAVAMLSVWPGQPRPQTPPFRDLELLPIAPRQYVCYRSASPLTMDGKLEETSWLAAPWTDLFIDIEGDTRPRPRFKTRAKMLWDDTSFYVALEVEEPDIWATLTERDSIIYNDNDVEVFIDPDGDTHAYYEIETNPLGTIFDLMLIQPYRDGGPPIIAWDVAGLKMGINLRGTINRPGDRDEGWTTEMGIPWRILREAAPGKRTPKSGEQWRVNFSRVEWSFEVKNGRYSRPVDPVTGKPRASDNWVWSPQGAIDMHMPERWGFVQFSGIPAGKGTDLFVEDPNDRVKWALRRLYYRQRRFRMANGHFAPDLSALDGSDIRVEGIAFKPELQATAETYLIACKGFGGATIWIRQDGKTWITR
jgi:hypothetical protein